MTGRVHFTPEAERQLKELDDWLTDTASVDVAQRYVSAILDHINGILAFPTAGRARDSVRPGMRTSTFKQRTLVAYDVVQSSGGVTVTVLGIFHGGQDWPTTLSENL